MKKKLDEPIDAEFIKQVSDFNLHNQLTADFLNWLEAAGFVKQSWVMGYTITHAVLINIKIWFDIDKGQCINFGGYVDHSYVRFSGSPHSVKFDAVKRYLRVIIKRKIDLLTEQYSM